MRLFSCLVFLFISNLLFSQNVTCKWIRADSGPVYLDTLVIEPSSIHIRPTVAFDYDPVTQLFSPGISNFDSVFVCYRILNPTIFPTFRNRDIATYENSQEDRQIGTLVGPQTELFDFGADIQRSGAISRGVTFGNRQNLFVNSVLNLQMRGKLSDNMNIEA